MPRTAPTACAATNPGTDADAIPANVPVNARPMVTAGLANDVDDVAQYAAPTQPATAAGASAARPGQREHHLGVPLTSVSPGLNERVYRWVSWASAGTRGVGGDQPRRRGLDSDSVAAWTAARRGLT